MRFRTLLALIPVTGPRLERQLRTFAYLAVVLSASATLALLMPTDRYYQEVDYAGGRFDVEIVGLLTHSELAELEQVAHDGSSLAPFVLLSGAEVTRGDRHSTRTSVYLTSVPEALEFSWFATATLITPPLAGVSRPWIDLAADVAVQIGASAGDRVVIAIQGRDVSFRVRAVRAIARHGSRRTAVAVMDDVAGLIPGVAATAATVATARTADEVRNAVFSTRPDVTVGSREQRLADVRRGMTGPSTGAVLALAFLGMAILVGLAVREASALLRSRRDEYITLSTIGVPGRKLALLAIVVEIAPAASAGLVSYWLVTSGSYRYMFFAALPPPFERPLLVALGAGVVGFAAVTGLTIFVQIRSPRMRWFRAGTAAE